MEYDLKFRKYCAVRFKDEHGNEKIGTINNCNPFKLNDLQKEKQFVGIITPDSYGCWVRDVKEIELISEQ